GLLHASEVVLGFDRGGIHRIVARSVRVPEIDSVAFELGTAAAGVHESDFYRQRHSARNRVGADAGGDVLANDAGQSEGVGAVRAVAGIRAGGLLGNDLAAFEAGAAAVRIARRVVR